MNSSSAFAAPLEIDLRPGRIEAVLRAGTLLTAWLAIALADISLALQAGLGLLACAWALRDWRRARARPAWLRLHADGSVESAQCDGHAAPANAPWQPSTLEQAIWFLGLPVLRVFEPGGHRCDCVLFPDQLPAERRQSLRVWLRTHAPASVQGATA